jgi:hypothetical protein
MLLSTGVLYVLGLDALSADRAALEKIGRDSAPNIVAAEELSAHLAGLDTELANALLGAQADRDVANELFELRRSSATRRLNDTASIGGVNEAERIPLLVVSEGMGRYLELAGRAQWLFSQGDRDGADGLMRLATNLMHQRILPAALNLDRINRGEMDDEFAAARAASIRFEVGALAAGLFLTAAFLATQVFITVTMRRRFVPALLAGTILGVFFTGYLATHLEQAREDLRVMHDDSFNSIHAMWQARAVATDLNGDESRWLLDRTRALEYEQAYRSKLTSLLTDDDHDGFLAAERANVTFNGELAAANESIAALKGLKTADARFREQEARGAHPAAVAGCIGTGGDSAASLYDRFDEAAQRVININQWAFEASLASGDGGLKKAEWLEPAFALAIALCAWLGVRSRLREYA